MSVQRRRVVVMASSLAAMSGIGSVLFRGHVWLGWTWMGVEIAFLVWVIVLLLRLRRDEGCR
jgi:hypothetical protein